MANQWINSCLIFKALQKSDRALLPGTISMSIPRGPTLAKLRSYVISKSFDFIEVKMISILISGSKYQANAWAI